MLTKAAAVLVAVSALVCGCTVTTPGTAAGPTSATQTAVPSPAPASAPANSDGWEVIGKSVQDRPIRLRALGHGPRKVLFIGGIHGDEREGAYTTAQLPSAFTDAPGLADAVTLTILEDANPDGTVAHTRENANGVDINRTFPATNFDTSNGGEPLSQPESRAVFDTINRIDPDLVIVAHAWVGREFVNFDGPARAIAERFSADTGMPVTESSSFSSTPGSLGSYFGRDRGMAVMTVEFLKGSDPRADWDRIRAALLDAIRG